MKKKLTALALSAIFLLTGCGNNTNAEKDAEISRLQEEIAGLKNGSEITKSEPVTTVVTEATTTVTTTEVVTTTVKEEPKITYFNIGDVVNINNKYEIKLKSEEFTYKVEPPSPSGYYSYYEVKDAGKIYYHVAFDVKNLGSSSIRADEVIDAKLKYDDTYEYTGFSTIEEQGGSDFTYSSISSIDPLETRQLHFLISVPEEVSTSGKGNVLTLTVDNEILECTGKTGNDNVSVGQSTDSTHSNTNWKSDTPITAGETVVVDNYAEVTANKGEFGYKVTPPNPSGYYTYYEVKDSGKIYAHISFKIKNLKPTGMDSDSALNVSLLYDNTYSYNSFCTVEEDGGSDFGYASLNRIDPLTTETVHYLIEVPEEVSTSGKPVVILIGINGQKFYYQLIE